MSVIKTERLVRVIEEKYMLIRYVDIKDKDAWNRLDTHLPENEFAEKMQKST